MDDRLAVALAYNRVRRAGALDYPAWCAAVETYCARHPQVSHGAAGLAVSRLLADAIEHIPEMIRDGLGDEPTHTRTEKSRIVATESDGA